MNEEMDNKRATYLDQQNDPNRRRFAGPAKTFNTNRKEGLTKREVQKFAVQTRRSVKPKQMDPPKASSKEASGSHPKCIFCIYRHEPIPEKCSTKMSPTQWKRFAWREKRCMICLSKEHGTKTCNKEPCKICQGKHHTLLHGARYIPYKGKKTTTD